jgi:NAD(P)-dependent dehydrogenase (short-subunit alcohol dehydrogenase family)
MKSFDLTGKTAIVTGCKRGIGFAMAEGLAEAGANIIGGSASLELQGSAIENAVTAIAPGYISTDNTEALREDPVRSQQILARIPAGRWGETADFKGPVVLLASEAGR